MLVVREQVPIGGHLALQRIDLVAGRVRGGVGESVRRRVDKNGVEESAGIEIEQVLAGQPGRHTGFERGDQVFELSRVRWRLGAADRRLADVHDAHHDQSLDESVGRSFRQGTTDPGATL
ncbi:hypothetical protein CCR95_02375 [Thiocystis minor]|nr:hypothetical protein [Thiocystis minor]